MTKFYKIMPNSVGFFSYHEDEYFLRATLIDDDGVCFSAMIKDPFTTEISARITCNTFNEGAHDGTMKIASDSPVWDIQGY